jgi:hypothetical protein
VIRNGYSNQTTLREQITKNIGDVLGITTQIAEVGSGNPAEAQTLSAQRKAILAMVCQEADGVTGDPLPADQAGFVGANCSLGVISPNSSYN